MSSQLQYDLRQMGTTILSADDHARSVSVGRGTFDAGNNEHTLAHERPWLRNTSIFCTPSYLYSCRPHTRLRGFRQLLEAAATGWWRV